VVLPALIQALKGKEIDPKNPMVREKDLPVRRKVAVALSKLKGEAMPALVTLREVARKETDVLLVCNAIHAIGAIGPEAKEAIPDLLARCPIEVNIEIRLAAISELGRMGPDAKEAIPRLKEIQREGRPDLRNAAEAAIKQIEAPPAPAPAPAPSAN
jgi:HEAT repeat protein